jgi:hypothetical protein
MTDGERRESVATWFDVQGIGCSMLGSAFYGRLCERMAADARAGGPVFALLEPHADQPFEQVFALRLLGGLHRIVLEGRAAALAAHYPTVGGDGDADAVWPALLDLVASRPPEVLDALTHPVQTNEVGRSSALVGGFLTVARDTGLPLRVLEVGASAGLNLRFDHYRYEQGGFSFGPSDSPVRFTDVWPGAVPPLVAPLQVVERAGCDRDPIDPTTDGGRLTLLSYTWPGQDERFHRLEGALDVARRVPAPVVRADLVDWLAEQLAEPQPGRATVVFHSIVWQYLPETARDAVERILGDAGARATHNAPVSWLRLEPQPPSLGTPDVRLTQWPGGDERVLANATFHSGPVEWLA